MSFAPYLKLRQDVDTLCEHLTKRWQAHLTCHRGCSGCCQQHLSVFPVEATSIQTALEQLQPDILSQCTGAALFLRSTQVSGPCPLLLKDGDCAIYAERPILCRSHGLPIAWPVEGSTAEVDVDVCPLNLTEPSAWESCEPAQDVIDMERLNLRLAATNFVYCRDVLQDTSQAGKRLMMADIVGGIFSSVGCNAPHGNGPDGA